MDDDDIPELVSDNDTSPPPLDHESIDRREDVKRKFAEMIAIFNAEVSNDKELTADLPDNLPPHILCAICGELLFKPVGLRCGHTFCRDCITGHRQCHTCRDNISGKVEVNRVLETIIETTYPAEYNVRKLTSEKYARNKKIVEWLPNSALYATIKSEIARWYTAVGKTKCTFNDCYNGVNRSATSDYVYEEHLWYHAWLRFIAANIGETHLPIAIFAPTDIPAGDLREIHYNQYSRLYNHTRQKEYIEHIRATGLIIKPWQIQPDLFGILLQFVINNLETMIKTFNNETEVSTVLTSDDDAMGSGASATFNTGGNNIIQQFLEHTFTLGFAGLRSME